MTSTAGTPQSTIEPPTPIVSTEPEVFKPIAAMTQPEIIAEIGRLEAELPNDEALYRQWETLYRQNAGSSTRRRLLIAGIILAFFNIIVGAVVIIIGLRYAGNSKVSGQAAQEMQLGQRQITFKRGRLAELQALREHHAPASADERLAELTELKAKGLINEAEYNAKRQEILNEI